MREQKGERLVEQLQSMLPSSSSSLPTTPQDADSPGSWWGPHEGGWVTRHAQQRAHPAAEAGAGCNGHGVSPDQPMASCADAHGALSHVDQLSHIDQLAPAAAHARASGARGDALAWGVPHVSAEAADDWHLSVHLRARSANVPAEVAAALRPLPSFLACLIPCACSRRRRPRACLLVPLPAAWPDARLCLSLVLSVFCVCLVCLQSRTRRVRGRSEGCQMMVRGL